MDKRELHRKLAQWGQAFSPDMVQGTQQLFAPLVARPEESLVTRNIAYGPDERHRVDIFNPGNASQAPVVLFIHGGGFVMGDKGAPDAPYYNNVGGWAIQQGFIGVTMTYRLAPKHPCPAGRDDVVAAIAWLQQNIQRHGGDPDKIFIMGQSAGATHAADVVAMGAEAPRLAGAVIISGVYDVTRAERNDFQKAYYGDDETLYESFSSLQQLAETETPCLYCVCEFDPPDFQYQAAALVAARVERHQQWPRMHWLAGHNHLSSVYQISSQYDELGPVLTDFVQSVGQR